jgi:hypothetical protein
MNYIVRQALALLVAVATIISPTGCTSKKDDTSDNPELKIPEIPPVSRDKDGKKTPEKDGKYTPEKT